MEDMNNNSPVVEFYDNKVVFITGATGFMGKVDNQNKTLINHKIGFRTDQH